MLARLDLNTILFLDIETVPLYSDFNQVPAIEKEYFAEKTAYQRKNEITTEDFYDRAGIWAEFGKIICISVGYFTPKTRPREFRLKSFSGDEKQLLLAFKSLVQTHFNGPKHRLCGHNAKEFDFPFIARRMLVHQITLPSTLELFNKKPWEVLHLDTLHLWRFGDYKHYTSLKLMAYVLGIPSPKDDIDGSQVASVFYKEQNIERIIKYCEKDVVTVAQVFLKLRNNSLLEEEEIIYSQ
ncbi:3'-5' exonuclease [Flavobacteriaceae bacterium]|nr:3'-5' exonuclease [Flavobacteriaceae bacterium]MDB3862909.1 3'-5' exonuclease [Flavobacteriaceae bacterium]MDC3354487.1 3'-5' exonuclease [Flavobacteriaceae bacterium]